MRVLRGFMSPRKSFEELAKINVANLVDYAVNNLHMDEADIVYATNTLLDMFRLIIRCLSVPKRRARPTACNVRISLLVTCASHRS